jgi:8-hydroxy-5-deazaflavin:NADPH oxidoreductase
MKIAVLGTGMVGRAIASKLIERGHEVRMGSRTADNAAATTWAQQAGERASHGTFADAADFGEVVFLCTLGAASVNVVESVGAASWQGKVLVDVSNPLDFSAGMPPLLFTERDESLGQRVQRAAPSARVVKALNTVNCLLMVDASRVPGEHDLFICGDDEAAKEIVKGILTRDFGWSIVHDLGPLAMARTTEMLLPLWAQLYGQLGTPDFNFHVQR